MTTIAFDGKMMAGDSRWSDNGLIITSRTKIARFPTGCLYGGAGETDDRDLVALLKKVKKPSQLPTLAELQKVRVDLIALMVFPDGSAWQINTSNRLIEDATYECGVCPVDVPFAIGSGRHIAIGAMDVGATAYEAVKAACKRDTYTDEPVTRLTLNPKHVAPKPKSRQKPQPTQG